MVRWVVGGTWRIGSSSLKLELTNRLRYHDREFMCSTTDSTTPQNWTCLT